MRMLLETSEKFIVYCHSERSEESCSSVEWKTKILRRCAPQNDIDGRFFRCLLIFSILLSSGLFAQVEARKPLAMFDAPEFFVDALSFSTGDSLSSRVDLYVQIPYDVLQFVKVNDQYVSKYEIILNFLNDSLRYVIVLF